MGRMKELEMRLEAAKGAIHTAELRLEEASRELTHIQHMFLSEKGVRVRWESYFKNYQNGY